MFPQLARYCLTRAPSSFLGARTFLDQAWPVAGILVALALTLAWIALLAFELGRLFGWIS